MPNDAYILRSDAVSAFCGNCEGTEVCGQLGEPCEEVKRIKAIPAADVEPVRHGRWVKMTGMMPPEFTGHYSCSECDWFCKKHSIRETEFDFCPGCGAEMGVEKMTVLEDTIRKIEE